MNSADVVISSDALIRIFVILLYVPVGLASFRLLIPRLSPTGKRLASGMLAAQILVIAVALASRPTAAFDRWLWDFHEEWNVPATLASAQLATVGAVALLVAWLARTRPIWQRLYFLGTGLVFLFLGLDEYLALHEFIQDWELRYIALGGAVVAATLVVAWQSPKRERIWHLCLLFGLAVSAVGAMVFNAIPVTCGDLAFLQVDSCLQFFVQEETLELIGIWLVLIAMLGHFTNAATAPSATFRRLLYTLPALWVLLLLLNSLAPRLELRLAAEPARAQFESGVTLHGYHVSSSDEAFSLRVYASGRQADYLGIGYSVHLVDQLTGESLAREDEWADHQHSFWLFGPDYQPLYRQVMTLDLPAQAPVNRALSLVLAIWRRQGGKYRRQATLSSDLRQHSETQVILLEVVIPADAGVASADPVARFDNGFTLDAVTLPESARAGETLSIDFTWRSDAQGSEDHVQFLHLGHVESGEWFVYDQQPLGARMPTRLWYSGLADSETWQVPLPADLAPGRYEVLTGLYRVSDKERVPMTDADGGPWLDNRVALGSLVVE